MFNKPLGVVSVWKLVVGFVAILGTLSVSNVVAQDNRVSLQTPDGIYIGTRESVDRDRSPRAYFSFRGVQYAKAERWQEPEMNENNGETVQATGYKSPCAQWSSVGNRPVGSEDCLFLNIFTPSIPGGSGRSGATATINSRGLLPVMVFFHPGSYMYGSSDTAGPRRFMKQDVVLVTVSSRLGVLGYLSTGDEAIGGNFGGLDQIMSLQWVQKHIRDFGGNPQRVTIFGNSAGAASVHLLMLSPRALGLFHGAILQSGSAFNDWAVESNPAEYAAAFSESIGCSSGDSQEMATCLKDKTTEELIEAQNKLIELWIFPVKTAPVVDVDWRGEDSFLPGDPEELMDAGAFAQVPVMAGVVHDEGLMGYAEIHQQIGFDKFKDAEYFEEELIPTILKTMLDDDRQIEVVADAVKTQYFQGIDVENETKLAISEMVELLGDIMIYKGHWKMLEKFATDSKSPVFSYLFTHTTPRSPNILSKLIRNLRQAGIHHTLFDYGVAHAEELFYLFEPFTQLPGNVNEKLTPVDEKVSDTMTKIWVSFATTGSPSNGLSLIPNSVPWRPIKPGNINYYNITSISAPMGQDFRKGEALFWLRTVPYIRDLGETISDLEPYPTLFWVFFGLFILFLIITSVLAVILWKKRSSQKVNL